MPPIPTSDKRPFIPAVGIVQVELVFSHLGQVVENVYHVQQGDGTAPATVAQMNALAASFVNREQAVGRQARNQVAVLQEVIARDLSAQSGPAVLYTTGLPIAGAGVTQPLPGNVTAAIKWNTALRGRSFRGRTYQIGMSADQITGDQLTAAFQAQLVAIYQDLLTSINGVAGAAMVVLSYAHNKFWRDAALATPITNPTVDINLDSQRRRLAGRGK